MTRPASSFTRPAPSSAGSLFPGLGVALVASLACFMLLAAPAARAQGILAQVNNQAITSLDVAQRIRIAALIERRRISPKQALEELIDDQAKVIEAGRIGYRVTEEGVENEFSRLAKANNVSTREFEYTLRKSGLEPSALRDKLRANIAWQALTRDRVKLGMNVSRAEIESAASERRRGEKVIEYTLVPVVFVVPPGASPGSRVAAANAARTRFRGCDTGLDTLRTLPDVVIRSSIVRSSNDLSKPIQTLLDKTPIGQMTPAAPGEQGIEMYAVCGKRDVSGVEASDIASVADEIGAKKMQSSAKAYLAEIRKKVTIRYHRGS